VVEDIECLGAELHGQFLHPFEDLVYRHVEIRAVRSEPEVPGPGVLVWVEQKPDGLFSFHGLPRFVRIEARHRSRQRFRRRAEVLFVDDATMTHQERLDA